ncbi:MAG: hypothetical protein PVF27_02995, partial [Gemmatimonadales bacterium]
MKQHTVFNRLAAAGLFAAVLALTVVPAAFAEPAPEGRRARNSGFNLLGAGSTWVMRVNRVECGMDNQGNICTDTFGSPTGGGGNWPAGSPDQYIFNSGLQIAGIIAQDAEIWAGDTVGAYFFDARGTQPQGQQVTLIYSSLNPDDAANWPNGAVIRDADIYNDALLGRDAISQEDTWVRYWDGPGLLSGRAHPMGILVEQRGLAWNFPQGNEDIIYWVFTFTNISASDASAYSGLDPAIQSEVAGLAADWVAETENRLGVDIPAAGYTIDSVFAAFAMDPDVGTNFRVNASTAILPFNMGLAYNTAFDEPTWLYPPDIFFPPFGPYPGFVGVKYLKSPQDPATGQEIGLSLFSNTTNSAQFPDPVGVSQLWRYLSGRINIGLGDPACDVNPPIQRRLCALRQQPDDTRFYQSSGPFSLEPGQSASIVVAYVHSAPIGAVVAPYFQQNPGLQPGIPASGTELANDPTLLRDIDRAAGWISANDDDADGAIEQDEVVSHRFSLLDKSLVAQELFNAKFLLPFAPESPDFFLVPGDGEVTVVWQPSVTETVGDPYYSIASDPASALYDPNYRFNDVEGYRIYRGRTRAQLELIAQFDYANTTFEDFTGAWAYDGNCAPELGVQTDCPVTFPLDPATEDGVEHDLVGDIRFVKPGGRVQLADGSILVLEEFNVVEDAGYPALANTGVPFAYIDRDVVNSINYFYAVTAFDVNSIGSGPGSLESPAQSMGVTPRAPSGNLSSPATVVGTYGRDELLNPNTAFSIDPAAGTFRASPPATTALTATADLFAPTALASASAVMRVDSVLPAYYDGTYYITLTIDGVEQKLTYTSLPNSDSDFGPAHGDFDPINVPLAADSQLAANTGQDGLPLAGQGTITFKVHGTTWYSGDAEWHDDVDGAFWSSEGQNEEGGSRWFSGENETLADPTLPVVGGGVGRGELPGITTIFSPQPIWSQANPYQPGMNALFRRVRQATWHAARQADVKFYWGSTPGTLDSVIDVTHNLVVPFNASTNYQAGWGFRNDIGGDDGSLAYIPADGIVTYADFIWGPCADGGVPSWAEGACETRPLQQQATLEQVDVTGDNVADGTGFALYFNHEFYIFQTDALPSDVVWTHRSYFGDVRLSSGGQYSFTPKPTRAPPGLEARIEVTAPAAVQTTTEDDLAAVHTVPDPYYVTSSLEVTPTLKVIKFVNLPDQAIIRIYSLSGVLVNVIEHNSA